jgi:ribonucleotide monophosphatase NagD (HAD superfamily)
VPFVLLTNGGGVTEEEKAEQISEIVGVRVLFFLFTRQQNTLIFSRLIQKQLFCLTHLCKTS